jgi:putative salt-induced outer membrane protein YdiY
MPRTCRTLALLAGLLPARALAQTCPCPPALTPGWHGNAGAGLAVTDGNSDTQTYNLSLLVTYDPQKRHVVRIDGLYLKSSASGEATSARSSFGVRDELKLSRGFLFADGRFQRDRFKDLQYLITPTVGAGLKLVDRKDLALAVDAGVGLALEKLDERDGTTDGALRAGQTLTWRLSDTASLTQLASALWKMDDFDDAFYHVEAGLVTSVNQRLELKLAALVDVKNKPASAAIVKTDKALLASLVFKF